MKISLLLTNPSPCLRYKILSNMQEHDKNELDELNIARRNDPILKSILDLQNSDGSFRISSRTATTSIVQSTSIALTMLAYLGFDKNMIEVQKAVDYLFSRQLIDGSWEYEDYDSEDGETYNMVPLQTAFPLWGISSVGCAMHPKLEKSYDWLLDKQLEDGAWPVGTVSGNYGYIAGYRKLPNSKNGCRVNTTCSLLALSNHPIFKKDKRTLNALDILLGRRTIERHSMGLNIARCLGIEKSSGFFSYFAGHDIALVLSIISKVGVGLQDSRVKAIVDTVKSFQNEFGLIEYEKSPIVTQWLTYDVSAYLDNISYGDTWINKTPDYALRSYQKSKVRY